MIPAAVMIPADDSGRFSDFGCSAESASYWICPPPESCKKRENKNPWTYSYVQGCIHTVPPWFSLIYPLTRGTAPFPILLYAVTHVRTSLTRLRTGIRQSLVCGHSTNRPALWILPTDYCFPQCLCFLFLILIISPDSDLSRPAVSC